MITSELQPPPEAYSHGKIDFTFIFDNKITMKNICLYIGSFDPPHIGHQTLVLYLLNQSNIDEVMIIPTYNHCAKDNLSTFFDRYSMLQKAFAKINSVTINPAEKIIASIHGPVENRTYATIQHVQKEYPNDKLMLSMGSDLFNTFSEWHQLETYVNIPIVIIIRENYHIEPKNATKVAEIGIKFEVINSDFPIKNISSSMIKEKIIKKESINGIVHHDVIKYVLDSKLLLETFKKSYQNKK